MSDKLRVNGTMRCTMCVDEGAPKRDADGLPRHRHLLGDPNGSFPRIAVCVKHDCIEPRGAGDGQR